MHAQDFAKFVASQQDETDNTQVDWAEIRDEWLKELDSLYRRIVDFLQEFVAAGSIFYSFTEVMLDEENIGAYLAKRMDIKIGRQRVFLEPIGTLLIGCRGRVDAVGSARRAQLILVNEKARSAADLITVAVSVKGSAPILPPPSDQSISWAWKIIPYDVRGGFVELEKESFFALLTEIVNA